MIVLRSLGCAWTTLSIIIGLSAAVSAEAPQVSRLLPAGGKRGSAVEVIATGKFTPWPVTVTDSAGGLTWEPGSEAGKFKVTISEQAPLGIHWLRFSSADGAAKLKPFIVGTYAEQNEQEPNEAVKQATSVSALPIVINGALEQARDVDIFALDLSDGGLLVATLTANEELGSPVDACMQILDAKGFVVAQNLDAHNLDPQIVFRATSAGKYMVRIFGFPSAPDSTIAFSGNSSYVYRLTLTSGAQVESPMPPVVSSVADTTLSWLGYGGPMPAGRTVTAVAAAESQKSLDSILVPCDESSEVFRLPVVSMPIVMADGNSSRAVPQSVSLPLCAAGVLATPRSEHVYSFEAKNGSQWRIECTARDLGSPLDPTVIVLAADDKVLSTQDDKGQDADPVFDWKCPADGMYRIVVRDTFRHGTPMHFYRLYVDTVKPIYRGSVGSDLFEGSVGKPIEVEIAIDRSGGFDEEVEFRLVDAPAGVTAEPVVSAVKGDTAKKVKLNVQAAQAYQGPMRITAESKTSHVQKSIGTSVPDQTLWLSVKP